MRAIRLSSCITFWLPVRLIYLLSPTNYNGNNGTKITEKDRVKKEVELVASFIISVPLYSYTLTKPFIHVVSRRYFHLPSNYVRTAVTTRYGKLSNPRIHNQLFFTPD
jgi:hypothetical protein